MLNRHRPNNAFWFGPGGPPSRAMPQSGQPAYVQGGTLMAAPFDVQRQALHWRGSPGSGKCAGKVALEPCNTAISATGSLVYVPVEVRYNQNRLVLVSRDGKEQPLAAPPGAYSFPHILLPMAAR